MATLLFIRHGESMATVNRVIGGPRTCGGLSPYGRRQVEALADRWVGEQFRCDELISSHYLRARETADLLAGSLGGVSITTDARFGELDPGPSADGISYETFFSSNQRSPEDWDKVGPYGRFFADGESVADMYLRVAEATHELADRLGDGTAVICCHGGVVDLAMRIALQTPISGYFRLFTVNTSITEVHSGDLWRLARYNDHAHLVGLDTDSP